MVTKLMSGLLALDLARTTGWAWLPNEGIHAYPRGPFGPLTYPLPQSGIIRIAVDWSAADDVYFGAAERMLVELLTKLRPVAVVKEAPLPATAFKGTQAGRRALGISALTEAACQVRKIRVFDVAASTIKKQFEGHGNAKKAAMIAACRLRGWAPIDDNEADALAALEVGIRVLHHKETI